ncbi:chromate transporter [Atractiella rhizophila]|nr:chromate transporter [Atractiella rhizophila]
MSLTHVEAQPENHSPLDDNSNVPRLTVWRIFWLFFSRFGIFVAQIALIKEQLVIQEKWISVARFNRVFAVYQMLPGPEAAELCMFFGCLAGGRLGGIAAGVGFILPGFLLMLLASYLYALGGFSNRYVSASFRALQPMVGAMIVRATHKIAEHTLRSQRSGRFSLWFLSYALFTTLNSALRINWLISLSFYGIFNMVVTRRYYVLAAGLFILQYVVYAVYVIFKGVPTPVALAVGVARIPDTVHLFALGLIAGSLSFGGAYTAIPFIQAEAVLRGAWLPQSVFLDGIAIGNIIPAPLVIFATFVGFQGGKTLRGVGYGFSGATVITLGMFFPCFLFTIAGHDLLERLCRNKFLSAFFDGIGGAVVGVIAITALQFLKACVGAIPRQGSMADDTARMLSYDATAAVLYIVTLVALYKANHKYAVILMIVIGALSGQFLFVE